MLIIIMTIILVFIEVVVVAVVVVVMMVVGITLNILIPKNIEQNFVNSSRTLDPFLNFTWKSSG